MTRAAELVTALTARGWTLGVAESLTGGGLTAEIVSVPGASVTLLGGVVAYATPVKASLLGVDAALLSAYGPVNALVAQQMATGVREAVAVDSRPADIGLSTTGVAGPDSPDGHAVGTVHIGIAMPTSIRAVAFRFDGDRASIRAQTVDAAIEALLEDLRE